MIRCRRLLRLTKDTEGSVLLETVIAFPVLLFTVLVLMELSLLYNGKQLANYAAFCGGADPRRLRVGRPSRRRHVLCNESGSHGSLGPT